MPRVWIRFGRRRLRRRGRRLELLVNLTDSLASGYQFGGLGEGLAEAGGGVGDLRAGADNVGEYLGLARLESSEAALQATDQFAWFESVRRC